MALTDTPPEANGRPSRSVLRSILPYTTVAMILAALYVAWTFYSRYEGTQKAQAAIDARKHEAEKRAADQIFGSGAVAFSTFGADSAVVKRGEHTELCYGVLNATKVKIEPDLGEETKPSYHHCVEIAPKATTTYTITAENGKGDTKTESITVTVR